jgi:hypothetical protein
VSARANDLNVILMPHYTVRVELHGVDDYSTLHKEMKERRFYQLIQDENTKQYFELPTAEYNNLGVNVANIDEALNLAIEAVNSALAGQPTFIRARNTPPTILVTQTAGRRWSGLEKIK